MTDEEWGKAVAKISALARQSTAEAMKTLVDVAKNKRAPAQARVAAAVAILDRSLGHEKGLPIVINLTPDEAKF